MPLILLTSPPFTFMLIFPSTAEEQPIRLPVILPSRTVRLTFPETFPWSLAAESALALRRATSAWWSSVMTGV